MEACHTQRVERIVDLVAATALATAIGYGAYRVGLASVLCAGVGGLVGFAAARILALVTPKSPTFALEQFELAAFPRAEQPDELILTDSDRFVPEEPAPAEELLLEDVLTKLVDESRVVRLFDPAAMPSPGELRDQIDRHLDSGSTAAAYPDASKALLDALSELRRSLH